MCISVIDGFFDSYLYLLTFFIADPNIIPFVKVDQGAIRSIISGADVMAPGLTSPVSVLPENLKPDNFVVRKPHSIYST